MIFHQTFNSKQNYFYDPRLYHNFHIVHHFHNSFELIYLIEGELELKIDTRTERLIEKGMDSLMQGKTVFVIAHRLSTVRNSNAIMVLENGEIIEKGDHDTLLEEKGKYYKLYTGQFELS